MDVRAIMRIPAAILIAACAMAAGCASLASRTREQDRDRYDRPEDRADVDRDWWQDNSATAARNNTKRLPAEVARTNRDGIIAGELVDAREGRRLRGKTFIVVKQADEVSPASAHGNVGVETDEDGYFFMPGLVPGKTYILSVVREIDGRKIAAKAQVKPPAGNIRLELDENKVSSVTPPLPARPGMGPFERGRDPAVSRPPPPAESPAGDRSWGPANGTPHIDPPAPPLDKEDIAGSPKLPPMAAIKPPPPPPVPSGESRKLPEQPLIKRPSVQRVPNFLVRDVTGNDWEFRYASGRLILMDFWSTTCVPCQRAIPSIKRLQADYGASGLEVVALDCEQGTFAARARNADDMARHKQVNYKVYLEREGHVGEVQRLFEIRWLPTLVLLDRQGNILWRGGTTDPEIARLDEIITTHLTKR